MLNECHPAISQKSSSSKNAWFELGGSIVGHHVSSVLSLRQNPVQEFEAGIEDRMKGVDQVRVGGKERW